MRSHQTITATMALRSIAAGTLAAAFFNASTLVQPPLPGDVHASSTSVSYSCTGTYGIMNQFTGYGADNLGRINAVNTRISYNTDQLIACGAPANPNYYWTAMVHPQSSCMLYGSIAQAGWATWYNAGRRIVQQFYYANELNPNDSTGGCNPLGVIFVDYGNYDTNYKVTLRYDMGCGPGWGELQFWIGGIDAGGGCFDWGTPGTTMQVSTERLDYLSHLGEINFSNSQFCTNTSGCTPNIAFPMASKYQLTQIDSRSRLVVTGGSSSWTACDYWDWYYNRYSVAC